MGTAYLKKIAAASYAVALLLLVLTTRDTLLLVAMLFLYAVSLAAFIKRKHTANTVANVLLLLVYILSSALKPSANILLSLAAFTALLHLSEISSLFISAAEKKALPEWKDKFEKGLKERATAITGVTVLSYLIAMAVSLLGAHAARIKPSFLEATLVLALSLAAIYILLPSTTEVKIVESQE